MKVLRTPCTPGKIQLRRDEWGGAYVGARSVRTRFASCSPISESFSVSLEARAHDAFNGFRAATYWDDSMRAALRMSALRRSATAAATALCCAVRRSATTCFRGSHEPTRRSVCEVNDDCTAKLLTQLGIPTGSGVALHMWTYTFCV